MKISQIFSALFPKVGNAQGPKAPSPQKTDSKLLKQRDEVNLAKEAKFISTLRAELQKSDAPREEKIREIQSRLDQGSYNVDSYDIAEKILGE
jgi:flagellar biosynthesis anti-sigma factor FlgM